MNLPNNYFTQESVALALAIVAAVLFTWAQS